MKDKNSEQCQNIVDQKRCTGLWYKYRVKPEDIKGFCNACNKKKKEKEMGIKKDIHFN